MTRTAGRLPALSVAVAVIVVGVLMTLDRAGTFRLGWSWCLTLACLNAGLGLLAVAPASRAWYAGALARLAGERNTLLWSLRGATVVTAPVVGLGPAAYALLSLFQVLFPTPSQETLPDWRRVLGTGLLCLSYVLAAVEVGLRVGDDVVLWSVLVGASALSVFWWSPGPAARTRFQLTVLIGVAALWSAAGVAGPAGWPGDVVVGAVAGAALVTLVVAPRWLRNSRALAAERERRARATERAELGSLVHDSVLQTLALIQSRADDPAEVKALARRQERALRARLFDAPDPAAEPLSVAAALRAVAAEVEDAHRVKVDAVTVGDAPLDERSLALVAAAREALFNAAKHAGNAPISLFGEIDERRVSAFVRDRGPGFDLEAVPADRRGVRDSIVARMVRHGGHAAVRTAPGGGCEVRLMLERRR